MMANTHFRCTRCNFPFNSDIELSSHIDKSECRSTADGSNLENRSVEDTSDSEWEYEYSTTETETFFVTLDLPVARSDANIESGQKGGRLTKRKEKWLNSTHPAFVDERSFRHTLRAAREEETEEDEARTLSKSGTKTQKKKNVTPDAVGGQKAVGNAVNLKDDRNTEHNLGATNGSDTNPTKSTNQTLSTNRGTSQNKYTTYTPEAPHDIQILEFHSKNPIVLYRNQQFGCNWAENIGTELLFVKHSDVIANPDANIPIVKSLPGEVDLLAVSGVRVVGHPINIKVKKGTSGQWAKQKAQTELIEQSTTSQSESDSAKDEQPLRIPISSTAAPDRKGQARFLEKLAAIKLKKGEHDEVTVNAVARKVNRERKNRTQTRKKAEKVLKDVNSSDKRRSFAIRKLQELDALDAQVNARAARSDGRKGNSTASNSRLAQLRAEADMEGKTMGQGSSLRPGTLDSMNENVRLSSQPHHMGDPSTEEDGDDEDESDEEDSSGFDDESDQENEDIEGGSNNFGSVRDIAMENEEEESVVYTPRDEDEDMEDYDEAGYVDEEGYHPYRRDSFSQTHTQDVDMDIDG